MGPATPLAQVSILVHAVFHASKAVPFACGCSESTEGMGCKKVCLGGLRQHGAWAALGLREAVMSLLLP